MRRRFSSPTGVRSFIICPVLRSDFPLPVLRQAHQLSGLVDAFCCEFHPYRVRERYLDRSCCVNLGSFDIRTLSPARSRSLLSWNHLVFTLFGSYAARRANRQSRHADVVAMDTLGRTCGCNRRISFGGDCAMVFRRTTLASAIEDHQEKNGACCSQFGSSAS